MSSLYARFVSAAQKTPHRKHTTKNHLKPTVISSGNGGGFHFSVLLSQSGEGSGEHVSKEECGGLAFLFAKLSKICLTSTSLLLLTNKTASCDLCKSKYTCLIYIKDALRDKQPQIKVPEVKKFNFKINLALYHFL